jgi:hypothetical protein
MCSYDLNRAANAAGVDPYAVHERAAIIEHQGGQSREDAEHAAVLELSYVDEPCALCGKFRTRCPNCSRHVHVDELRTVEGGPVGCVFCSPVLCPKCGRRRLPITGCYCRFESEGR